MAPEVTAFALGGAGTKGAFEVGAVRYAVAEKGLTPGIITGTSAGSLIALILAQARGHDELLQCIDDLQSDLLAMTDTSIVFAKQPWLKEFDGTAFGEAIDDFITVRTRPAPPPDPDGAAADAGSADAPSKRRKHKRWHDLVGVLEELRPAARARKALPEHVGSLLLLDPLGEAMRGNGPDSFAPIDPARVARPGLQLRLGITPLHAGTIRYVTEDATIVEADAITPVGDGAHAPDVIEGALASSTVPMIFEPRAIGDDVYVDGGVLQNVPVEAAAALGADNIVAVLGVPLATPPDPRDFTTANFVGIHLRAGAIQFSETQRRNVARAAAGNAHLTVIAPTVDVVGPFEVAQGLMLLDMDYGWMRACDTFAAAGDAAASDRARATSDAATSARERAWFLEEELWASTDEGTGVAEAIERLRRIKREVFDAVQQRRTLGLATPANEERWWLEYERHAGDRPAGVPASPWDGADPPRATASSGAG